MGIVADVAKGVTIVGSEFIRIAVPATKKAAKVTMTFVNGGVAAVKDSEQEKTIALSEELDIVNSGLSLPLSFTENQFTSFPESIQNELCSIKGQNEMLFLSNSISYFIDSHSSVTGLDRSISYALQNDIEAVRHHLKSNRDIRFPGYLLHQCASLAETIKELNIFYVSVLSNGTVPSYTLESARTELAQRYGAHGREASMRSYIPYRLQLPILRELDAETKEPKPLWKKTIDILGSELDDINDKAHEALYILSEELIANEELEAKIHQKLMLEGHENGLLVKVA